MKYTKAQWHIDKDGRVTYGGVEDAKGWQTWQPLNEHWPTKHGDTALVASAPDMYEALLEIAKIAQVGQVPPSVLIPMIRDIAIKAVDEVAEAGR